LLANIGGTTMGSVEFLTYVNGVQITDSGALGSGPFENTALANVTLVSTDVLKLKAIVTHGGGPGLKSTSFNAQLQSVPDGGATAILFGVSLLGLGAFARRKP
jgi:hypothetical protein